MSAKKVGNRTIDLNGKKFGRLTVIELGVRNKQNKVTWKCLCDCGNYKTVASNCIMVGDTKSCGCLQKEASRVKPIKANKLNTSEVDRKLIEKRKLRRGV